MKKVIYILLAAFLFPLLHSCSNEEEQLRPGLPELEDGTALLRIKFDMPKAKGTTYANATFNAAPDEKEVKSIAIFTKNNDEGTGPDLKRGAFNKFFSTEDLRSATGLYEPLEGSSGSYNTTVKVRSDGFGKDSVKVFIIANYAENGLTQKLKDILTYDELATFTTEPLTDNPQVPLLMVGETEIELTNGGTANEIFELFRLASRIDIENLAETAGFTLTEAYLVNPRTYTFVAGGNPASASIPVADEFTPISANSGYNPKATEVNYLYTYETDNSTAAKATAVMIKGLYNGVQYEKKIPLKQPDKDGVTGDPIPLARNFRYQIKVQPSQDPTEVTWNISVAPWADGEVIEVKPSKETPELTNIKINGSTTDPNWDPNSRIYRIKGDKPEKLTFTVRSMYTTNCTVNFKYHYKAAHLFGLEDENSQAYKDFLKRGTPVVTYANVDQDYEITLPNLVDEPTGPIGITITLESPNNRYNKTDITFLYMTGYDNTALEPVLVDGRYWAPVNVGATQISTTSINKETTGNAYQWGRNQGYSPLWASDGTPANASIVQVGPVEYDECESETGIYKNSFIAVMVVEPVDWLKKTDIDKWNYRNKRWSPEINDSPCPKGWRLPTNAEIQVIIDKYNPSQNIGWNHFIIGDKGDKLYFPRGGYRGHGDGKAYNVENIRGLFWGAEYFEYDSGEFRAYCLDFHFNYPRGDGSSLTYAGNNSFYSSYAWQIRCVQQDVGDIRNGG